MTNFMTFVVRGIFRGAAWSRMIIQAAKVTSLLEATMTDFSFDFSTHSPQVSSEATGVVARF